MHPGVFHGAPVSAPNNERPVRAVLSRSGRTAGRPGPAPQEPFLMRELENLS